MVEEYTELSETQNYTYWYAHFFSLGHMIFARREIPVCSALDKPLGQLGIHATWLSSIAYLQKQLHIFIFFTPHFFSVITRFHIA